MEPVFTGAKTRSLTAIFERGAEEASLALTKWLGQPVQVAISAVAEVELAEAADLLGPADELVGACAMELTGPLSGHLLMVFQDRSGLALADLLLRNPLGTAAAWGELEQSAAMETANIVGCSYLNSLAAHLPLPLPPGTSRAAWEPALLPSPPTFRHEFAGSLLEFAVMDQAVTLDRLLVVECRFTTEHGAMDWSLLLVPSCESLHALSAALDSLDGTGTRGAP
jgi:chemotaxis protein CheC